MTTPLPTLSSDCFSSLYYVCDLVRPILSYLCRSLFLLLMHTTLERRNICGGGHGKNRRLFSDFVRPFGYWSMMIVCTHIGRCSEHIGDVGMRGTLVIAHFRWDTCKRCRSFSHSCLTCLYRLASKAGDPPDVDDALDGSEL